MVEQDSPVVQRDAPYRILYVEDNPDVMEIVVELFEQHGCVVYHVKSAIEALDLLRSVEVDLVFSDIRLGLGDNGVVLAERIRALYPNLLVVLTTGYASIPVEGITAWNIVQKPFNVDELMRAFGNLLSAQRRIESPEPERHPESAPEPAQAESLALMADLWQRFVAWIEKFCHCS